MTLMRLSKLTALMTERIKLMTAEKMHTTRAVCKITVFKFSDQAKVDDCSAQSFIAFMKLSA